MIAGTHTAGVLEVGAGLQHRRLLAQDGHGHIATVRVRRTMVNDIAEANANAQRLVSCWNTLHGLTLGQIERMGKLLDQYNSDEVDIMLKESGF